VNWPGTRISLLLTFTGSIRTKVIKNFGKKRNVGVSRDTPIFGIHPIISGTGPLTSNFERIFIASIGRKAH